MRHFIKLIIIQDSKVVCIADPSGYELPRTVADVEMGKDFRDAVIGAVRKGVKATVTYDELHYEGLQVQYYDNAIMHVYRVNLRLGHGRLGSDCQLLTIDEALPKLKTSDSYILKAFANGHNHSFMFSDEEGFMQNLV